jgi:uncharacterized protein (TIGR00251 family)
MNLPIREDAAGITFDVQVVPRASREQLGPVIGDRLKVHLTAPPVEGAANDALTRLFASSLKVPRAQVHIVRGETGRKKTLRIDGAQAAALRALIHE